MAIWQYTFHILPISGFKKLSVNNLFINEANLFDDEPFWKDSKIKNFVFDNISYILKKDKSWSSELDIYGDEDSNCLKVLHEGNLVVSVALRIDFRTDYETILRKIIEFCYVNNFVFIDEELKLVNANYDQMRNLIESSPQKKKYSDIFK